ncbi:dynamin-2A-like [Salvia splendens]|uniref:dynamin-2A-like n=2 Tax=Salvia splendens TaxID=180675 RepID=UPI001C2661ED|nr:dynamin-2A-like [Salvia splendens]XP_042009072.1 dynamin-2A-like [Salvia splendens]
MGGKHDGLVRLQLEALLEEKSRSENENSNLNRENKLQDMMNFPGLVKRWFIVPRGLDKEDMLFKLYSSVSAQSMERIEELLQEDQNVKRRKERIQKQSSILSKLTTQLCINDNLAAAASTYSNEVESSTIAGPSSRELWRCYV